jgi:thymidylate kinase
MYFIPVKIDPDPVRKYMRKLIVMEGVNGCGKSTVIKELVKLCPNSIVTSHPGSTDIGKELRRLLKFGNFKLSGSQELALFAADAMGFYNEYIRDKEDNVTLICDRLNITGAITYQRAKGVSLEEISAMYDLLIAFGWTKRIDKLFIFDAPYNVIQARIAKPNLVDQDKEQGNKKDRFESAGDDYMKKVHKNYCDIINDINIKFTLNKFVSPDNIYRIDVNRKIEDVIQSVILHL